MTKLRRPGGRQLTDVYALVGWNIMAELTLGSAEGTYQNDPHKKLIQQQQGCSFLFLLYYYLLGGV